MERIIAKYISLDQYLDHTERYDDNAMAPCDISPTVCCGESPFSKAVITSFVGLSVRRHRSFIRSTGIILQ